MAQFDDDSDGHGKLAVPNAKVAYPNGTLRAFSNAVMAGLVVGIVVLAATVSLAVAYAYRIEVLHDVVDQRATPSAVRNADNFVTWLYFAKLGASVAWVVMAVMTMRRAMEMLGIERSGDAAVQKRRYNEATGDPRWKLYQWWQKSIQVYFLVTVLLRLLVRTTDTATVEHFESANRRGMILSIVDAVLLVAIIVLGWRAKAAVESTAKTAA